MQTFQVEHRDIFLALNGAGEGKFGVVTAITMQTSRYLEVSICECTARAGFEMEVVNTWFQIVNDSSEVSLVLILATDEGTFSITQYAYIVGDTSSLSDALASIIPFCDMDTFTLIEYSYADFVSTYIGSIGNDWKDPKLGITCSLTSIFLTKPFDFPVVNAIKDLMSNVYIPAAYMVVKSLGRVLAQPTLAERSAFAYRDAIAAVEVMLGWEPMMPHNFSLSSYDDDPIAAHMRNEWIRKMREHLTAYGKGAYLNWPDQTFEQPLREYFGNNLETLLDIKQKYDPENWFCHRQSFVEC